MDQLNRPSIPSLSGNLSENWRKFIQQVEIFLLAAGKDQDSEDYDIAQFGRSRRHWTLQYIHVIRRRRQEIYKSSKSIWAILQSQKEHCIWTFYVLAMHAGRRRKCGPVCYATETHCETMWIQRRGRNATGQNGVWAEGWFSKGESFDKRQSETEGSNRYCKGCKSKQETSKTDERKNRQRSQFYEKSAKKRPGNTELRVLWSDSPTKSLSCISQGLQILQHCWACRERVQKESSGTREISMQTRRAWQKTGINKSQQSRHILT